MIDSLTPIIIDKLTRYKRTITIYLDVSSAHKIEKDIDILREITKINLPI